MVIINLSDDKDTNRTIEAGPVIAFEVKQEAPSKSLKTFAKERNKKINQYGYPFTIKPVLEKNKLVKTESIPITEKTKFTNDHLQMLGTACSK